MLARAREILEQTTIEAFVATFPGVDAKIGHTWDDLK
jgi:hypothetical protein